MKLDRDCWPLLAFLALTALVTGLVFSPLFALAPLAALIFSAWFFRDPERSTPREEGVLIAPADGRIIRADTGRVSVFMNLFDVHVCRSPTAGDVESVEHEPGHFWAAYRDGASEYNERTTIALRCGSTRIRTTLVAGLVARRIVCRVTRGQRLAAGERVGLIRFGSRVDVDLPVSYAPCVEVGRRVRAGETIIALRNDSAARSP